MSSNPPIQQAPFTFTPPGTFSQGLPFVPTRLKIDNPSSYYLSFPNIPSLGFITPYTFGAVVAWNQVNAAILITTNVEPANAPVLPASAAAITILATTDSTLPVQPGTSIFNSSSATLTGPVTISGPVDANITNSQLDITGPVSISAGQSGVNVSTDAPPVAGPTIVIPAGQSSVTDTLHPPSNATAIGFAFEPLGFLTLNVQVQDALTLVYLEDFTFAAGGSTGRSFTIPLTPGMTEDGIIVTATASGTVTVNTTVGYTLWYIGTNSIQPVNLPTQPLYVEGSQANGSTLAVDQLVAGIQGSGQSVQTISEPPQLSESFAGIGIAAGATVDLIAGAAGKSIRIRAIILQLTTGAAAIYSFQSETTAVQAYTLNTTTAIPTPAPIPLYGFTLPVGEGLVVKNTYTSAGGNYQFNVLYSQY